MNDFHCCEPYCILKMYDNRHKRNVRKLVLWQWWSIPTGNSLFFWWLCVNVWVVHNVPSSSHSVVWVFGVPVCCSLSVCLLVLIHCWGELFGGFVAAKQKPRCQQKWRQAERGVKVLLEWGGRQSTPETHTSTYLRRHPSLYSAVTLRADR